MNTKHLTTLFWLCLAVCPAGNVYADVLHVPSEYTTIQAAIDAAVNDDSVLVADGTYAESINFNGKAITVVSENGPASCVIDCIPNNRGVEFSSGEDNASIFDGFTVKNASIEYDGGGIYIVSSSPLIMDCIIEENVIYGAGGGGIFCDDASPIITGCTIRLNGSIYSEVDGGSRNISSCSGGIHCQGTSAPVITWCEIVDNYAASPSSPGTGTHVIGGIYCGNSAAPAFVNCLIAGNEAADYSPGGTLAVGGIISEDSSVPEFINCTIADNSGDTIMGFKSGGIYTGAGSIPVFTNCIIWASSSPAITGSPVITYSDVEVTGYPGTGNFTADPLFETGTSGSYCLSQVAAGQTSDSPCINAGDSNAADVCFPTGSGSICLDLLSTRTDEVPDDGVVNLGFHYAAAPAATPTPADVPATGPVGSGILLVVLSGLLGLSGFRKTSSEKRD